MKKSKFTESQIIKALKENDQGRKTDDICREMGIHKGTIFLLFFVLGTNIIKHL